MANADRFFDELHVVSKRDLRRFMGFCGFTEHEFGCRACDNVYGGRMGEERPCGFCGSIMLCSNCVSNCKGMCPDCYFGTVSRNDMLRLVYAIAEKEGKSVNALAIEYGVVGPHQIPVRLGAKGAPAKEPPVDWRRAKKDAAPVVKKE